MKSIRIAVAAEDASVVATELAKFLDIELEPHDSGYWGSYWKSRKDHIRVLENFDPMYLVGEDPPEERYFEANFSSYFTLVDFDQTDDAKMQRVMDFLRMTFGDCAIVRKLE